MRPTLPAERGSPQLAASAESLVTDAERSNRRVTCLLHTISDVTRVRHAQGTTLSILRAFIACADAVQTAVLGLRSLYKAINYLDVFLGDISFCLVVEIFSSFSSR